MKQITWRSVDWKQKTHTQKIRHKSKMNSEYNSYSGLLIVDAPLVIISIC